MVNKTHAEMIREAIKELGNAKPRTIMDFINRKYPEVEVKKDSFRADIIGCSVNHTSSHHYPGMPKFLFYEREKGMYQLYNPEKHGKWIVSKKGAYMVGQPINNIESEEISSEAAISLERDLEEYIIRNLGQIDEGLKLYSKEGISGRQFNTNIGKVDILSVDKNNNFVVIELKAGTANYSVIGQVLGYIHEVRQNIASGKEVKGIIIADDFEKKLMAAVFEIPHVSLKKYRVNFTFEDV